jgi:hypothetical protein
MSATTNERLLVHAHDAELRVQRGERIVRHLGPRRGNRADERGLAGVRHAEESHVGEHAQLQLEHARFPGHAARELARRAVHAGLEVEVAQPAVAALGEKRALAVLREVRDRLAGPGIADHGADGEAQDDVLGAAPVAIGAAAVLAGLRAEDARVAVVDERVEVRVGDRPDAAAAAAVAAVRAAARHELLAPERSAAVAALAGHHLDSRLVEEFHRRKEKAPSGDGALFGFRRAFTAGSVRP